MNSILVKSVRGDFSSPPTDCLILQVFLKPIYQRVIIVAFEEISYNKRNILKLYLNAM